MVDRIDRKTSANYWAVHSKEEPKHDGEKKDQGSSAQQDQFAERESLDSLLKQKVPRYKQVEIRKEEVKSFTFKNLLPKKQGAILELDVTFKSGHVEKGVRLALAQEKALDFMKLRTGAELALDHLFLGSPFLTIGVPQNPSLGAVTETLLDQASKVSFSSHKWFIVVSLLVFFLMILVLVRILLL